MEETHRARLLNYRVRMAKIGWTRVEDWLVLSADADPFNVATESRMTRAEWFGELWKRYAQLQMHLRRLHYVLVSLDPPPTLPNGNPYVNTEDCWNTFQAGSRDARYLLYVDPTALEERRSPRPIIHAEPRDAPVPELLEHDLLVPERGLWLPPTINLSGAALTIPTPTVLTFPAGLATPPVTTTGYDYTDGDQPYLLEVWIEKSTMNDVLDPICAEAHANLVPGLGFSSITRIIEMIVERCRITTKPARIFYISDFDPGGKHMPVQVARQLETWCKTYAPDTDIKMTPLALTHDQVQQYRLPRVPIKESDKRRTRFEMTYGEGAVELDALEALHPGALGQIVRDALAPYVDQHLPDALQQASDYADTVVKDAWEATTAPYQAAVKKINQRLAKVLKRHTKALNRDLAPLRADAAKLEERYGAVLARHLPQIAETSAPFETAAQRLRDEIAKVTADFAPELPARPQPQVTPPDEADWLFDSSRDEPTQLKYFRRYRPKATTKKRRLRRV